MTTFFIVHVFSREHCNVLLGSKLISKINYGLLFELNDERVDFFAICCCTLHGHWFYKVCVIDNIFPLLKTAFQFLNKLMRQINAIKIKMKTKKVQAKNTNPIGESFPVLLCSPLSWRPSIHLFWLAIGLFAHFLFVWPIFTYSILI